MTVAVLVMVGTATMVGTAARTMVMMAVVGAMTMVMMIVMMMVVIAIVGIFKKCGSSAGYVWKEPVDYCVGSSSQTTSLTMC